MCDIIFKFLKSYEIPNDLRLLTDSLVGYSFTDDSPIYNIKLNVDNDLINHLLFDSLNNNNHIEDIKMYVRKQKTKKLLGKNNNKDIEIFTSFLQHYIDNINHMMIIKYSTSEA